MKITVFTSNQPRHIALLCSLARIADTVFAVQECNTVFPGEVTDFFAKSTVMQRYFAHMIEAERCVFGGLTFLPGNVHSLAIKMGDLNRLSLSDLQPALSSDHFIVFGSSYIKGALCDRLVARQALNIHMGMSPWYRGSSCNFWALYDGTPELVGATIHRLSLGLDSGDMLFHAVPPVLDCDGFELGMRAVQAAQDGLVDFLTDPRCSAIQPIAQNRTQQIRYTRNRDFTDQVADEYLARRMRPEDIAARLSQRDQSRLLRPYIGH